MSMSDEAKRRKGKCPSKCDICQRELCDKPVNHTGSKIHACVSHRRTKED